MAILHFGWLLKQTGQFWSLGTAAGSDINQFTLRKVPDCKQHLHQPGEVNPVWPGTRCVSPLVMWQCLLVIEWSWLTWKFQVSEGFCLLLWSGFFLLLYHGGCINVSEEFLGILVYITQKTSQTGVMSLYLGDTDFFFFTPNNAGYGPPPTFIRRTRWIWRDSFELN